MKFAAIATVVGFAGAILAANIQGDFQPTGEGVGLAELDSVVTGSLDTVGNGRSTEILRLIDLRTGITCRVEAPDPSSTTFTAILFASDCGKPSSLSRITSWRSGSDGTLIMADSGGGMVLQFAPADGALYESIYPADQLMTIVPVRG